MSDFLQANSSLLHTNVSLIRIMFKKNQPLEGKKVPISHVAPVGGRKWHWLLIGILTGAGVLGPVLWVVMSRSKSRRKQRKRSILIEPPHSASVEGEEARRERLDNLRRLHVSHSAPVLLTQPHNGLWDVVIVGGGPCGSTAAFYLAKAGISVLVIEKDVFPRDKVCGDQIQPHAQQILSDMGVLQTLLDEDVVKWTTTRGIVSPAGISFIGEMKEKDTLISVQRIVLDKKMMEAATKAGASLRENLTVKSAHLSRASRRHDHRSPNSGNNTQPSGEEDEVDAGLKGDYWTIHVTPSSTSETSHKSQQHSIEPPIFARLLLCADGANSHVARSLTGLSPDESPAVHLGPANAVGCRCFAKHRTHHCRADEVSFYTKDLLPGSFRISSELEDFLNLSCFVLPSDDYNTTQLPLRAVHQFNRALTEPWINATLGPDRQLTPVRSAPMRVGGVNKTYFPHGVIVGDAAGHTDPLSGDGLQYGMRAAKMAAETFERALSEQNYSANSMQRYESGWKAAFGWDFFWGRQIVYLMARFPILVDAVALVIQRHGMKAISFWALAKAGYRSKWELILWFLRPDVAWLMAFYSLNLWLKKRGFF